MTSARPGVPARRGAAALLGGVLTLAACGSGSPVSLDDTAPIGATTGPTPSASPAATAAALPTGQVPAPLTGLPVDRARAALPAVAASVLVESGGAAPRGLDAADVVFVDYVEPGAVRLISLFQSRDAEQVGPLGWARPEDAKSLAVFGPVLAHDGGPRGFLAQLPRLDVAAVSNVDRPELFRAVPGSSEFTSTAAVRDAAGKGLTAPPTAFTTSSTAPVARQGVGPAAALSVNVPAQATLGWTYDPGGHVWRATVAGAPVAAANLVVLDMPYTTLQLSSPRRYLPSPEVTGSGVARVLSQGTTATGRWSKLSNQQLLGIADAAGYPFALTPGSTWVVLVPPTGKAVVG